MQGTGFELVSKKENVGTGMACGLLAVIDLPFSILCFLASKLTKKIEFRSLGLISMKDIANHDNKNIGFYLGVLLFGQGIGCWASPNYVLVIISSICALCGIYATIKFNTKNND